MFCEFLVSLTKSLSKRANQKSKKLSCKPFSRQARNGFSLLSGCRGDSFLSFFFSFLTVWMHFQPASEKSQSKQVEYVFSLRKPLSACKPEKSDKLEVTNSVFSGHSSKAEKSIFFLRKSARNCPPAKVVRSQKSVKTEKSVYVEKKDSSSKIFQCKSVSFFLSNYAR
jgi:hypothetical protein